MTRKTPTGPVSTPRSTSLLELRLDDPPAPGAAEQTVLRTALGAGICDLRFLRHYPSLRALEILYAPDLTSLHGLESCPELRDVSIRWCQCLTDVTALSALSALEVLGIESAPTLTSLEGIQGKVGLRDLTLRGCPVAEVPDLRAPALMTVILDSLPALTSLRWLAGSNNLQSLRVAYVPRLASLDGLEGCHSLVSLRLLPASAPGRLKNKLRNIRALAGCLALVTVVLNGCAQLRDVSVLGGLVHLESVCLSGSGVSDVSCLAGLPKLKTLGLLDCKRLVDVTPLKQCAGLRNLGLNGTQVPAEQTRGALRKARERGAGWESTAGIPTEVGPAVRAMPDWGKRMAEVRAGAYLHLYDENWLTYELIYSPQSREFLLMTSDAWGNGCGTVVEYTALLALSRKGRPYLPR